MEAKSKKYSRIVTAHKFFPLLSQPRQFYLFLSFETRERSDILIEPLYKAFFSSVFALRYCVKCTKQASFDIHKLSHAHRLRKVEMNMKAKKDRTSRSISKSFSGLLRLLFDRRRARGGCRQWSLKVFYVAVCSFSFSPSNRDKWTGCRQGRIHQDLTSFARTHWVALDSRLLFSSVLPHFFLSLSWLKFTTFILLLGLCTLHRYFFRW